MPSIELTNFDDDHVSVTYPMVLVEGQVEGLSDLPDRVQLQVGTTTTQWPLTAEGTFKALAHLPTCGKHTVVVKAGGGRDSATKKLQVTYAPRDTEFHLRFYYQKCADSDGTFDAPEGMDNSVDAAVARIGFNAMLLQCAMAEQLNANGFGRETFATDVDAAGQPVVHVLETTSFSTEEAHNPELSEEAVLELVITDLNAQGYHEHDGQKHAIILGMSHFDVDTKETRAHVALGSGRVCAFSSCGLHSWASHVGEVTAKFLDNARLDGDALFNDGGDRTGMWAQYATGLGALNHEVGHVFGLPHSADGIMSRGFDDMNRVFCVYQPKDLDQLEEDEIDVVPAADVLNDDDGSCDINLDMVDVVDDIGGAYWHRASALTLHKSQWISDDATPPSEIRPTVNFRSDMFGLGGKATEDGDQTPFGDREDDPAVAFRITFGGSVDRLEVFTADTVGDLDGVDEDDEGEDENGNTVAVFKLGKGEVLVQIQVYSGAWVDGLRFTTNKRSSRLYGAPEDHMQALTLRAPKGQYFYSLFGSHGNVLGQVGAFAAPLPGKAKAGKKGGADPPVAAVVIDASDDAIALVYSVESVDHLDDDSAAFVLHPGDAVVQVDVCHSEDDDGNREESVVGLCVHTASRASAWYGAVNDHIQFIVAPEGQCFHRVGWNQDDATIEYEFGPLAVVRDEPHVEREVDEGEPNITLSSAEGLAYAVISVESPEIARDYNVDVPIEWPEEEELPTTWRISMDLFRHHVAEGRDVTQYAISAVDRTGATTEAPYFPIFA